MNKKKITSLLLAIALTMGVGVANVGSVFAEDTANNDVTKPVLTVESNILGLADTSNKSTLKQTLVKESGPGDTNIYYYDAQGNRQIYEDQLEPGFSKDGDKLHYQGEATLSVDPHSKVDSSQAEIKLIDGNGYYADELILSNRVQTILQKATWENGKTSFQFEANDLTWNNWDYYGDEGPIDPNSGREWSMMGGDGNGVYYFNLEVTGLVVDGQEVEPTKIPVAVYIYGRSCTDLALSTKFVENTVDEKYTSNTAQTNEVQWVWETDNQDAKNDQKPYMNDTYTDYFTIVWPKDIDASKITAEDVKVTLRSQYDDEYVLSEETSYGEHEYAVITRGNETVVAITYQQWSYIPVYNTMEIAVDDGDNLKANKTYDISSVTAYVVQTGGGGTTVDHTVTCYNYYGINKAVVNDYYTLSVVKDGTTYFYAKDANGNAELVAGTVTGSGWAQTITPPENVVKFPASKYWHNATYRNVAFVETRMSEDVPSTQVETVDGEEIEFIINKNFNRSISDMVNDKNSGVTLLDGYNLNGCSADKWAWTFRYQSGWGLDSDKPDSLPYKVAYPFGYAADAEVVTTIEGNPVYNPAYKNEKISSGPGGMGPGGPGGDKDPMGPGNDKPTDPTVPGDETPVQPTDPNQEPVINVDDDKPSTDVENNVPVTPVVDQKTDEVKSGDMVSFVPWAILLCASMGVGIVAINKKRKSE